jgi:hypothetical protein
MVRRICMTLATESDGVGEDLGLFTVPYYGYGRTFYRLKWVFPARSRTIYQLTMNSNRTVWEIRQLYYGQRVYSWVLSMSTLL